MNANRSRRLRSLSERAQARALDLIPFVPYVTTYAGAKTEQEQAKSDEAARLFAAHNAGRIRIGCVWRVAGQTT